MVIFTKKFGTLDPHLPIVWDKVQGCKGVNEGEATGQLFGRLFLILMKANSLMLSTRCQDADFPSPAIDGIE